MGSSWAGLSCAACDKASTAGFALEKPRLIAEARPKVTAVSLCSIAPEARVRFTQQMSVKTRIHHSCDHFISNSGDPLRTVISSSADCTIIAWHLEPGQTIGDHIHPQGQDTWTVLAGNGDYRLDAAGASTPIGAGDVVIAEARQVHGVTNTGSQPLRFISIVCPLQAGYEAHVKPASGSDQEKMPALSLQ